MLVEAAELDALTAVGGLLDRLSMRQCCRGVWPRQFLLLHRAVELPRRLLLVWG